MSDLTTTDATQTVPPQSEAPVRYVTIPNALCVVRFVGSFGLGALALIGEPQAFFYTFLFLTGTDWIDGKLAKWFDQRSAIGPKLDSVADVAMYAALLFGSVGLKGTVLLAEAVWIGCALATYAISCVASLIKFRRFPSYHTRSAKTSWLLVLVAAGALFLKWSIWPLRVAMVGVTLANLEAILLTSRLQTWTSDIRSILDVSRTSRTG